MLQDDQLVAIIEAEEANSLGNDGVDLVDQRAEALARYNAEPYGDERNGRSKFVSGTIRDQVEAVMPSIARVFLSGEEVGKFEPISREDEMAAERETLCVNWAVMKGGGWNAIHNACKDALLLKNGFVKLCWEEFDTVEVERYEGMSQEELAMLTQDGEVEVVEASEYPMPGVVMQLGPDGAPMPPPMVYDVKVERKVEHEGLRVEAVPPDELWIANRHRSIDLRDASFVQHRVRKTVAELREEGYDVPDDISDDENPRTEGIKRSRYNENWVSDDGEADDPTRRIVLLRESWIKLAMDGKKQVLWRICLVGKKVVHKEEADLIPIANFVPLIYQHSPIGVSYYDILQDIAQAETVIQRNYLDSLYFSTSPAMYVNSGGVGATTLDDLLTMHPGKIIRGDGVAAEVLQPIAMPDVSASALQGLEYISSVRENRTGVARVNQGALDPNALNRTATGAGMMMSAGQARIEFICRSLAEGVKQMFLIAHALILKHSTKPIQIKLKNDYIAVNPREWAKRTDFNLSVALGTGAPEQQIQKLMLIGQQLQPAMAMGLAGPRQFYNYIVELLRVAGYRSPDKFITEPKQQPAMGPDGQPVLGPDGQPQMQDAPPPQSPPPEVMAAKAMADGQVQKAQIDGQVSLKKSQGDSQAELQREQMRQEAENLRNLQDNATKIIIAKMQEESSMMNAGADRMVQMHNSEAQRAHDGELSRFQEAIRAETSRLRPRGNQ